MTLEGIVGVRNDENDAGVVAAGSLGMDQWHVFAYGHPCHCETLLARFSQVP